MVKIIRKTATGDVRAVMEDNGNISTVIQDDEEVIEDPRTLDEFDADMCDMAGTPEPGNVKVDPQGTIIEASTSQRTLDTEDFRLLLLILKAARLYGRADTDPVTYGDLRFLARQIRKRIADSTDDGSIENVREELRTTAYGV